MTRMNKVTVYTFSQFLQKSQSIVCVCMAVLMVKHKLHYTSTFDIIVKQIGPLFKICGHLLLVINAWNFIKVLFAWVVVYCSRNQLMIQ